MHVIAITVLTVLVVGLGSLEGVQLTTHTLFPTFPYGAAGSNQAGIASGSACDSTSQDNTYEDTHSRHHQREQDVDVWCLQ